MNALLRNQSALSKFVAIPQNCNYNKFSSTYRKSYLSLRHYSYAAKSRYSDIYTSNKYIANYDRVLGVSCYDQQNAGPFQKYVLRNIHRSRMLYEHTPSSKVEATVQSMKDKQKEKVEEIMKEAAAASAETTSVASKIAQKVTGAPSKQPEVAKPTAVVKKPLKTRIWEELVHYYHGFRLLVIDINVCRKLLGRVLSGKTLTRRENKLLVRTTSDLFRLIPFSVFIIVPFMELLLPVFIKFFPGMLPSTFQTAEDREDKLKRSLQMKLEMAKFLQKTLDEMAVEHKDHKSDDAKQFSDFFRRIKDTNEHVTNEDIIKYAKRFEDEITLDSLSVDQLSALCRLLELNTMGTSNLLRFQLRFKLRSLAADDRVIAREGVNSLDLIELQQACKARGMRAYGLTANRLRAQLQEWIDLSLNEKVPPTLLLLSRALLVSDETTTTDKLKETIRVLPDSVAAQTKAAIGEREGKIDNKTKIEVIKEEERKIREEREEERQEQAARAETLLDKAPVLQSQESMLLDEQLKPAAHSASGSAKVAAAEDDKSISTQDVNLLSEALKSLSPNKKMLVEKETIKEIKEELAEYKEDVEELREVRNVVQEPVYESRAAKLLFNKVNDMIDNLDKVVTELSLNKKQECSDDANAAECKQQADFVHVEDLVSIVRKLQQTSNESRLKQIENILSKIDADKDGVISVEEVLKVVENLGRENIKLSEKQIEEVVTLLDKETLIEAEERIEKAIAKSIKEAESIKAKKEAQKRVEADALAAAQAESSDELKDKAPEITDKATDLSLEDKKNTFVDKETLKPAVSAASATSSDETSSEAKASILEKETEEKTMNLSTSLPPIPPTTTSNIPSKPKDKML